MADTKAALIREMLEDGLSPKEIKTELKADGVEVTSQYVYNVKRRWNEGRTDDTGTEEPTQKNNEKDTTDEDYFTRFPQESRKDRVEMEEYECGNCGGSWSAPRSKYQARCPECGVELI